MIQFLGVGRSGPDEVVALVDAMRQNAQNDRSVKTYSVVSGIKIIADPQLYAARPDYAVELQWTLDMALRQPHIVAHLLEGKDGCPNLVPELEVLVERLFDELRTLELHDHRAVLQWLARLVPATWHKETLCKKQKRVIVDRLAECAEYQDWRYLDVTSVPANPTQQGQYYVKAALIGLSHFCLNERWLLNTRAWLNANR